MQRIFIENTDEQVLRSINNAFNEADIDYDIDNGGRYMVADDDVKFVAEILENGQIVSVNWELV